MLFPDDIKELCYGRDDLLAVAEKICFESKLPSADGEELCEILAKACAEYIEENNRFRTLDDTQIFKEYRNGECKISEEELLFIQQFVSHYSYYDDKANGLYAFSFDDVDQKKFEEWGMVLVSGLNEICESWGEDDDWYLGDINEEYVYVD